MRMLFQGQRLGVELMRSHAATITQRGQVTIPAAVRRLLKVTSGDKVLFEIDDHDQVRLVTTSYTLETAYRSIPPLRQPLSDKEVARIAKEEKAASVIHDLRDSL